ncbi:brp/Blh family beta-carotene 15,15'-monooxygenase [Microvirga ossetica]|uniref:Probable membrane transporter protein n=1 Tax=Microvirga ossetica TaxID=1882682 RepID=A0A1B2EMS0_9HYPH|nr:sulfite exporter TauE/SafE family protein [Microvirga ossetica]ANY81283.1 brp/Blh family beta-carotene 15,15'-monooxygenase [Microvirga ossetica]
MIHVVLSSALIAGASLLYATAGQSGGTAFLAVMAFLAFPVEEMRPTSLVLNIAAATYATWRLHRRGAVDWTLLRRVGLPALPAAFLGGLLILGDRLYLSLTGIVLIAAAGLIGFRRGIDRGDPDATSGRGAVGLLPGGIAGGAAGFLSGLTGVGGGVFLAPVLITLGWASPKRAAAISAPFILANSVVGLVGVLASGQRVPPEAAVLVPAALLGAAVGTWIGLRYMSEKTTRWMLAGILAFAGVRLLLQGQ